MGLCNLNRSRSRNLRCSNCWIVIRIRKANGDVIDVPADGHFVELVNDVDGTVGAVFMQPSPGTMVRIVPGSSDSRAYEQLFAQRNVKFSSEFIDRHKI